MDNKSIDTGLTMYQMRKQQYASVNPLDAIDLLSKLEEVSDKVINTSSCYYMLLCNERKDYSVFVLNGNSRMNKLKQELLETLQNRGEVMDIFNGPEGGWEIWIRDNDECFCYYLFNYEYGIITI